MKKVIANISPLPFYDSIEFQNHRKDYAFGQVFPLITYKNMLLPFQVVLAPSNMSIGKVSLINFNTGDQTDITDYIIENGLKLSETDDYSLLSYPGTLPIPNIVHEGLYYITISFLNDITLYSEVFTVTNRVDDYLLIEYWNHYNFELKTGIVDFSGNFRFKCYLNTQIGKPEYDFEEEATERMGYSFIESQVSKKIYKFTFLAPEYLCDALRIVRLCSEKQITSKNQTYDLISFSMEPKWEDQGDLAAVECEFETDNVLYTNIGGYALLGGDFDNNDFNTDFYDVAEDNSTQVSRRITIGLNSADKARIDAIADGPARSNLVLRISLNAYMADGTSVITADIDMLLGETSAYTSIADQISGEVLYLNITSAAVVSKGVNDDTIYVLDISRAQTNSIGIGISTTKDATYVIGLNYPAESDVRIRVNAIGVASGVTRLIVDDVTIPEGTLNMEFESIGLNLGGAHVSSLNVIAEAALLSQGAGDNTNYVINIIN